MVDGALVCDEDAWSGLEEQRRNLEQFLSRRCRDANEVDDVVQETMLRAARFRRKLDRPERLRAWIASIAANVLLDRVRRDGTARRRVSEDFVLETIPAKESIESAGFLDGEVRFGNWLLNREKALACLSGELKLMDRRDRELLMSFYGQTGGCREVAEEYGVSPSVVKVRLFRARNRLLRAVRRRFALASQLPTPKPC